MQVFFQFDVRTVAVFVGMTFLIQAAAIGAQAYMIRDLKQYRGVIAALAANLIVAVGLMLRLFDGQLPDFLTAIVSNILFLTGPALYYVALSQFTGFPYSKTYVIGVVTAALLSLLYFTYWQDDLASRLITLSLGSVAMVLILLYQLWQTRKTSLRFSANLMLGFFLINGISLVFRTISLIADPPQETFSLSPAQSATYLFSFGISFFWSIGFILMVSQRLRNDLMDVATMDVLTGIPNRRATQLFLEKELSRARRNHSQFSVLLIDIDRFKQVNDKWGHSVGDHVLVRTAAIFQSMIRKQDWVGRWGGEEFLMIVPGSSPDEARFLGERLRTEIAGVRHTHGNASFCITISVGVTRANENDEIDEILKKADTALYTAKQTRNTVSVAD
jgi:diguanylate cyclase (GGDEF)-like protein